MTIKIKIKLDWTYAVAKGGSRVLRTGCRESVLCTTGEGGRLRRVRVRRFCNIQNIIGQREDGDTWRLGGERQIGNEGPAPQ